MKNLQITKLLATATTALAMLMANQPTAIAGNDGSGGGNLNERMSVTRESIRLAVMQAPFYIKYGLNVLEQQQNDYQQSLEEKNFPQNITRRKLISKKIEFLGQLKSAKLEMTDADCRYNGQNVDGSVTADGICISLSRIEKKGYSESELLKYVTALYAHEISHRIGFNEEEAEHVQMQYEAILRIPSISTIDDIYSEISNSLEFAKQSLPSVSKNFEQGNLGGACASLSFLATALGDLSSSIEKADTKVTNGFGFLLSQREDLELTDGVYVRLLAIIASGCGVSGVSGNIDLGFLREILEKNQTISSLQLDHAVVLGYISTLIREGDDKLKDEYFKAWSSRMKEFSQFEKETCFGDMNTCYGRKQISIRHIPAGNFEEMRKEFLIVKNQFEVVKGTLFRVMNDVKRYSFTYENMQK